MWPTMGLTYPLLHLLLHIEGKRRLIQEERPVYIQTTPPQHLYGLTVHLVTSDDQVEQLEQGKEGGREDY